MAGKEVAVVESDGGKEVARSEDRLLRPVASPGEVLKAQESVRAMVEEALEPNRDFGVIPGTGSKPTLLKPGAERICLAFGVYADFVVLEQEVDHDREVKFTNRYGVPGESQGLYRYVIRCELKRRDTGAIVGTGIGVCSSMEAKYISRPRDVENTVAKMGKKRAQIDATLTTFGLSEMFTQDIEDMVDGAAVAPAGGAQAAGGGDDLAGFLDSRAMGKRANGRTWREMIEAGGEDRGFVEWAADNADKLNAAEKKALKDALFARADRGAEPEGEDVTAANVATAEQFGLIDKLLKSHVFTEAERDRYSAAVSAGITKQKASELIERIVAEKDRRLAAEKEQAAAAGQPEDDGEYGGGYTGDPEGETLADQLFGPAPEPKRTSMDPEMGS